MIYQYFAFALLTLTLSAPSFAGEPEQAPFIQLSFNGGTGIYTSDLESTTLPDASVDVDGEESIAVALDIFHSQVDDGYLTYHLYLAETNAELKIVDSADQAVQDIHFATRFYQVGGTYRIWAPEFQAHYFGGATIGLAQLDASRFDRENQFAFSLFGGIDKNITPAFGVKLDARIQGIVFDTDASIFCSGGCVIETESDVWWSYHFSAGLYLQF